MVSSVFFLILMSLIIIITSANKFEDLQQAGFDISDHQINCFDNIHRGPTIADLEKKNFDLRMPSDGYFGLGRNITYRDAYKVFIIIFTFVRQIVNYEEYCYPPKKFCKLYENLKTDYFLPNETLVSDNIQIYKMIKSSKSVMEQTNDNIFENNTYYNQYVPWWIYKEEPSRVHYNQVSPL